MLFSIVLTVLVILLYIDAWLGHRKNTKEIDDLRVQYSIANEAIRDLKTRIGFLEMFQERSALPEAESEKYKI